MQDNSCAGRSKALLLAESFISRFYFRILLIVAFQLINISARSQTDIHEIGAKADADVLFSKGNQFLSVGRNDSAAIYFTTIVTKYRGKNNEDVRLCVANSLINLGYIYTYHYVDYARAYGCLQEAIVQTNDIPKYFNRCVAYLNLANIYLRACLNFSIKHRKCVSSFRENNYF